MKNVYAVAALVIGVVSVFSPNLIGLPLPTAAKVVIGLLLSLNFYNRYLIYELDEKLEKLSNGRSSVKANRKLIGFRNEEKNAR